jgi:hypothetical protein
MSRRQPSIGLVQSVTSTGKVRSYHKVAVCVGCDDFIFAVVVFGSSALSPLVSLGTEVEHGHDITLNDVTRVVVRADLHRIFVGNPIKSKRLRCGRVLKERRIGNGRIQLFQSVGTIAGKKSTRVWIRRSQ